MNLFHQIAGALGSSSKGFSSQALSRSFFVATNPTPGTGIASTAAATSRSATVGLLNVYNSTATTGSTPRLIIPVRLRLIATQANTSGSDFTLDFYLDAANRYSSGGSAITEVATIDDADSDFSDPTSNAAIHFGDLTLSAETDETLVHSERVMKTIFAANDVVDIWFGSGPAGSAYDGTHMEGNSFVAPPMWLGPGANLSIHGYGSSQTDDPAFEFAFWYIERPNEN